MEIIINTTTKENSLIYRSWICVIIMGLLFGMYYLFIQRFYLLIITIIITLPVTLIAATRTCHHCYFKALTFNSLVIFSICFYPLIIFNHTISIIFMSYCLIDGYLVQKKIKTLLKQPNFIQSIPTVISNRDQFSLDHELIHGRIWQRKYHLPLLYLVILFTIPLAFLSRLENSYFLYVPVSLFLSFFIWEYTIKRFIYFSYLFKSHLPHIQTTK